MSEGLSEGKKKSRSFRDLDVWNLSIELAKDLYQLTGNFPHHEKYGLTDQIRRSAVSIPSNIAEGQSRNSLKEFKQFLYIAMGSLGELETQLIIASKINYISEEDLLRYSVRFDTIRKMLRALASKII
jgi:four helix bundle protein